MGKNLEILKKLSEGKESTWLKEAKNRQKYALWYDLKFWFELKWIMFINMEDSIKKRSLISIGVIVGVLILIFVPYYVGVLMEWISGGKYEQLAVALWMGGMFTILGALGTIGLFQIWLRWLLTGKPFKNS